jgi:alkanesulfonate monooxygenase SsuD/methylene tetrahydromethanopterin reductase-like flavin-dependent oxidoreductase (luciferase family)
MRFALSLPNVGSPARLVELAVVAEQGGWDGVFLWDHLHLVRAQHLDVVDPWVTLGAMANATARVRLGTMVTPLPRRRPWKVAKEITTLDHLSNGRAIAGIGLGFPPDDEFEAFGESGDARVRGAILDEGLSVLDGCLRGGEFRFSGAHHSVDVDLHPAPVQLPRPPIWVAGMWPNRRPVERSRGFDGYFPVSVQGEPLDPSTIEHIVATLEPAPGFDVVASWAEGFDAAAYEAAGATWLVDSRWPVGGWYDELLAVARRGPG